MTEEYNPLRHSVVQALLKADATQRYEADDFIEALLRGIQSELERVYWNVKQEGLDARKDWQFLDIPGLEYRRYYWGDCDCGADSPAHLGHCRKISEHDEWNRRRLDAISDPPDDPVTAEEMDQVKVAGLDTFAYAMASLFRSHRRAHFGSELEREWMEANPHPSCSCGAEENWTQRDSHLATCSPQLPNLRYGDVTVNWYKHLGRGMSVNVDWDERRWREWFDSALRAIRAYEGRDAWEEEAEGGGDG